jgi:hypothetical protein
MNDKSTKRLAETISESLNLGLTLKLRREKQR